MPTNEEQRPRGIVYATNYGPSGAGARLGPTGAANYPVVETRIPTTAPAPSAAPAAPAALRPVTGMTSPARASRQPNVLATLMPSTAATLRGSGEDAAAAVNRGRYGAAAGHVIRGAAALPIALADDVVGQPLRQLGAPVAAGAMDAVTTAFTGGEAQAQPAPVARPTAMPTGPNAADIRLARGDAPGAGPSAAAAPGMVPRQQRPVAGAPGVRRLLMPDGRVLYSNQDDANNAQLMAGGGTVNVLPAAAPQVSTGTDQALATARAAAAARGDWQAVADSYAAQGQTFNAPQVRRGPSSAAAMLREQFAGKRLTARGAQALAEAERNETAVSQAGAEMQTRSLQNATTVSTLAAQQRYQQALAGGDAQQIEQAERELRALQGSWPAATPQRFGAVPIPGGIDPITGMSRGSGAIVFNQATGEARIISPEEAKGQGAAPQPLPAKDKLVKGQTYQTQRGPAKWDGAKFIPV